jgi:predicted Zn-dependent protease
MVKAVRLDNARHAPHSSMRMTIVDANQSLRRAEQAFLAGQLDAARTNLVRAKQCAGDDPAILHLSALVEKKSGNIAAAKEAFEAALRLAPDDSQINMNYANLLQQMGEFSAALTHYDRAIAVAPHSTDIRFNRALVLQKIGRLDEALAEIDLLIAAGSSQARFYTTRGIILRALGRLAEAAEAFDHAIRLDPKRLVALLGRARVAIERGEDRASEFYENALAAHPANLDLVLGLAEALEAEGRARQGISRLGQAVDQNPAWTEGQTVLARMRWEAGEGRAFTRNLESVISKDKGNAELWSALARTLAGADLRLEAAEAAADGVRATDGDPRLRLMEAHLASEAGDLQRADLLFASLPKGIPARNFGEARHALRSGRIDQASQLLEDARQETPWEIGPWAMTSLAWRLTGDPRTGWLNDQPGFVRALELELGSDELVMIADRLRTLHRTTVHPLHQSLRGGTQTRGRLFERSEPEILLLANKIREAVSRYWNDLPLADPSHPLLRHRDAHPLIEGSWSVRLTDGGFHVAHFHPAGLVSSAAYLMIPQPRSPMEGWLEIGSSPVELSLPLEPLQRIEPAPGRLALFPSYMFHGTRPFAEGERITAAFDVVTA